jgi:hypothetical protein
MDDEKAVLPPMRAALDIACFAERQAVEAAACQISSYKHVALAKQRKWAVLEANSLFSDAFRSEIILKGSAASRSWSKFPPQSSWPV